MCGPAFAMSFSVRSSFKLGPKLLGYKISSFSRRHCATTAMHFWPRNTTRTHGTLGRENEAFGRRTWKNIAQATTVVRRRIARQRARGRRLERGPAARRPTCTRGFCAAAGGGKITYRSPPTFGAAEGWAGSPLPPHGNSASLGFWGAAFLGTRRVPPQPVLLRSTLCRSTRPGQARQEHRSLTWCSNECTLQHGRHQTLVPSEPD